MKSVKTKSTSTSNSAAKPDLITQEIRPGQSLELLKELHILTREGKLNQDSRRKLKQVYHLYGFIEKLLLELPNSDKGLTLADHGAGKSYLGFILYDLCIKERATGEIIGIETRQELVEKSRELAARLHPLPQTSLNAKQLKYRDFLTVALKIRSDDLFPDNWIYIHDSKVKVGRIQNFRSWSPEMVPEGKLYPDAAVSDTKETYKINKYGNVFTISWETVVNDDMDAISRIPAMQGAACRRLQNQAVYGVLTANAAMADTGALFNATAQTTAGGHANLATGSATPTVATLNAAFLSMMTKKGLRSDVILNLQPSFLIVPAALSATALQLVGSFADPAAGGSAAGNSNTKNIYGPNADRPLKVIVEPLLDANSATAFYFAASNNQVDTVELTFLEGEQSPVLENEWDFDRDVYKYKVRQTFGVAAIDYRGLYKHAGV